MARQAIARYFLSASIPDPRREPVYYETADLTAIREAVTAICTIALKRGELVFGGHPAISPLVLIVAKLLEATDRVRIFQSEYFRDQIPAESAGFGRIEWTPKAEDRDTSLRVMRETMIGLDGFRAAFFVGGMEGVEQEFAIFHERWSAVPAFPIASTGAAAGRILDEWLATIPRLANNKSALKSDVVYSALIDRLLDG